MHARLLYTQTVEAWFASLPQGLQQYSPNLLPADGQLVKEWDLQVLRPCCDSVGGVLWGTTSRCGEGLGPAAHGPCRL